MYKKVVACLLLTSFTVFAHKTGLAGAHSGQSIALRPIFAGALLQTSLAPAVSGTGRPTIAAHPPWRTATTASDVVAAG